MAAERQNYAGMVAVAIANPMVRRGLMDALRRSGAEEIVEAHDLKALVELMKGKPLCILVADDSLNDQPLLGLFRNIRRGTVHAHPFPLIIVIAHDHQQQALRALIDSGPDAVLLAPVSVADLYAKIAILAQERKPFVVTREYVGPDRRGKPREGEEVSKALTVEVPNPLAADMDSAAFQEAVAAGQSSLQAAKIQCSLGQLAWAMKSGNEADFTELRPLVDQLIESSSKIEIKRAAIGLGKALMAADMAQIMAACRTLIEVAAKPPQSESE